MPSLSNIISQIPDSPTQAANARAKELKAAGRDIVSFTVGEPDFDTPQHIKDGAIEALEKGLTKYTVSSGIPALREAICQKVKREQGIDYSPAEVIVTNGGKHALAAACGVLLNPGDEAVVPAPYWTSYPEMARLFDGKPVIVETTAESGYIMSPEQLNAALSDRTKVIFLNTPSNPTGACYDEKDLKALAEVISSHPNREQITVLTDEVYEYITYGGFKHVSFIEAAPELRENTLLINAFSKSYSMTGWRVGYAVGPKKIIAAMGVHQSQFTSNVCSIAQYAAVKAYEDKGAFPSSMQEEFTERLEIVCRAVDQMSGVALNPKPRGAFFAFLQLDELVGKKSGDFTINSGADFARYLLEKYDVVVVQGDAFGAPKAVRMSFAVSREQLEKGLSRIAEAVSELQ